MNDYDGGSTEHLAYFDPDSSDTLLFADELWGALESWSPYYHYNVFQRWLVQDEDTPRGALLRITEGLYAWISPYLAWLLLENEKVLEDEEILHLLANLPEFRGDGYREVRNRARAILSGPEIPAYELLDPEEYVVYGIVLSSIAVNDSIAVSDSTILGISFDDPWGMRDRIVASVASFDPNTYYRFVTHNGRRYAIRKESAPDGNYGLVHVDSLGSGTEGLIRLSRVGFNSPRSQALMWYESLSEDSSRDAYFVFLVKESGVWEVNTIIAEHDILAPDNTAWSSSVQL